MLRLELVTDFREFIEFPFYIYRYNNFWVPPLISEERKFLRAKYNPFIQENSILFFIAKSNGVVVGRISLGFGEFYGVEGKSAYFGHFDVVDDFDVFKFIFHKISAVVRERGINLIIGPINFSTNFSCGLLTQGFDKSPSILMPYNFDYYPEFFKRYGFNKITDLYAFEVSEEELKIPEKIIQFEKNVSNKFVVRNITYAYLKKNIKRITDLFNQTWSQNLLFQKLYPEQTMFLVESFKNILVPELCFAIEYEDELVAFCISLPDYSAALKYLGGRINIFKLPGLYRMVKRINALRVAILGVSPRFRRRGLDILMIMRTIKSGRKHGFKKADISWVLETNKLLLNTIQKFNPILKSIYRVYQINV